MPTHHQAIAQAINLESLQAWKAFSLVFWEEADHGLSGTRQSELFHAGFMRSRWALYDLRENSMESYLSDFQVLCLQVVNAKYHVVLGDRLLCNHVMANYFHVPTAYCVITPEKVQWLESSWWGGTQPRNAALQLQPLQHDSRLSLQRIQLPEIIDPVEEQQRVGQLRDMVREQGASVTVTEAMRAHPALAGWADENLLHVLVVREPQDWQPELVAITLVLSRHSSRYGRVVNRVEEGAVSASIDLSTGLITACRMLDDAGRLVDISHHPDTGVSLLGQRLPEWEQARAVLLRFFDESSYLRYCHLTFMLTEQGLSFFAAQPDQLAAHQMHLPLLDNASIDRHLKRLTD